MFKKIKDLLSRFDDIERHVEYIYNHIPNVETKANDAFNKVVNIESKLDKLDKLDEIDKLTKQINELTAENIKLKEENAIYLKYYDINSEATDEIKKEVFTEFEMRRLQKVNETLGAQLTYAQYTATVAGMTALSAYNWYRPWGYC